jgi:PAS domain S-box-containing protein
MSGLRKEELIGEHSSILIAEDKEIRKEFRDKVAELFNKGHVSYESALKRKDGKHVEVGVNSSLIKDEKGNHIAGVSIFRDISERKRAEREIRKAKDFLENVIENSKDGILTVDDKGYIKSCNTTMKQMSGFSKEEMIGKHASMLTIKDEAIRKNILEKTAELFEKGFTTYESIYKSKYGKYIDVECTASMIKNEKGDYIAGISILRDITERKKTEQELRETKKFLEDVIEHSLDGIIICDTTGKILSVNSAVEKMSGYSRDKIINQHTSFFAPKDKTIRSKYLEKINQLFSSGATYTELPWERKDGSYLDVEQSSYFITNDQGDNIAGVSIIRDITERKKAEKKLRKMSKALRDSYEKLEENNKTLEDKVAERTDELKKALSDTAQARDRIDGIVKSVADGLIVTDIYNRVILMNRTAEDLLGVRFSDVINRPIDFAIADETLRDRVTSTLEKKRTGYRFDFELPGDDPKQPRIMRARTSVIYDKEGRQTGIVTIIHDVTHEREVDRMKTEFISTAAHELRTPLTSIQGFSEIMLTREDISNEEGKKFLTYINKQAISLTTIVNDLLDISRIESGRGFTLNKVPCNLGDTIRQVVPYFRGNSSKHHFEIDLPKEPVEVLADTKKMEEVLENLIGNAVKYSPGGGLIRVTGRVSTGNFEVSVEDQGFGMTPEQVEKFFDKFYRADTSNSAIEGTGLGTTIVKHIVEAHGGKIWVESEYGKGTVVRFAIPA